MLGYSAFLPSHQPVSEIITSSVGKQGKRWAPGEVSIAGTLIPSCDTARLDHDWRHLMDSCKGIVLAWVMDKQTLWDHTNHDKPHLAHSFFVVVVHLADQGIAEVHSDALDGLVLPALVENVQQQLVHAAVLELQLLGNAEVTQCQTAVPLYLGQKEANIVLQSTDLTISWFLAAWY